MATIFRFASSLKSAIVPATPNVIVLRVLTMPSNKRFVIKSAIGSIFFEQFTPTIVDGHIGPVPFATIFTKVIGTFVASDLGFVLDLHDAEIPPNHFLEFHIRRDTGAQANIGDRVFNINVSGIDIEGQL